MQSNNNMTHTNTTHPLVMGIINVNEDSFYSESRCNNIQSFSRQLSTMISQGASIIDIGACSTRPGSQSISMEEEWRLLEGPLDYIAKQLPDSPNGCGVRISIDTFRSGIVRRAYDKIGSFIVNDISAGEDDPMMLTTVGELGLEYIAMHKRGTPSTMQQLCHYPNGVVREVADYFIKFEEKIASCGIKDYILDPGFGFAKTVEQNYELFSAMPQLMQLVANGSHSTRLPSDSSTGKAICGNTFSKDNSSGEALTGDTTGRRRRLLVGISRKSMIYKPLGITPETSLTATAALNLQALMLGADILRVHDVKEAVECLKLHQLLTQKPQP